MASCRRFCAMIAVRRAVGVIAVLDPAPKCCSRHLSATVVWTTSR